MIKKLLRLFKCKFNPWTGEQIAPLVIPIQQIMQILAQKQLEAMDADQVPTDHQDDGRWLLH